MCCAGQVVLSHCGLVILYGDTDLDQQWLRWWFVTSLHQNITRTNVDFTLMRFCGIHLKLLLHILNFNIVVLTLLPHLLGDNELILCLDFCCVTGFDGIQINKMFRSYALIQNKQCQVYLTDFSLEMQGHILVNWVFAVDNDVLVMNYGISFKRMLVCHWWNSKVLNHIKVSQNGILILHNNVNECMVSPELSSYPGYFWEPHWFSIWLLEISRITLGMQQCPLCWFKEQWVTPSV